MTGQKLTRDFTSKRVPIEFTAEGDVFRCQKALPLGHLKDLMSVMTVAPGENRDPGDAIDGIRKVMKLVLKKESYRRFVERFEPPLDDEGDIADDDWEPFDHNQLMETVQWLVEVYTKDPSRPLPSSATGSSSGEPGQSSTAGAPPAESTP